MIRIICTECKNAYLQNKEGSLVCPSCGAAYDESKENLLLGVQYYNEENYTEADNCFMKYIVKNSLEPLSIFYKALCDARDIDEDTASLQDTYKKIINIFDDVSDEDFPKLIALANDETEKIEKLLAESHVRLFADADAEKIKKQVEIILNIESEARTFRAALSALVANFNERSPRKISAKFSDCFFVESDLAAETGEIKYQKICDNVASHTVFTGILTNDIKNLEIYFRCIVMFFQKSYDKYKFLLEQSEKFTKLAEMLEEGQYNTIKGTGAVADKLKSVSYEFLQESYKEHFDEQIDMQTETVVIIEPEIVEEPQIEEASEESQVEEVVEETAEEAVENLTEEAVEEPSDEENAEENVDEVLEATVEDAEETEAVEASEETEAEAKEADIAVEENEDEASTTKDDEETAIEEIGNTIINEDVIEIEISEAAEEEVKEIEDISSTSETEIVAEETADEAVEEAEEEPETEPQSTDDAQAVVEEGKEADDSIVEIEAAPKYETVESDIPVEEDEEDEAEIVEAAPPKSKKVKKKKGHKVLILFILLIILAGIFAGYKYVPGLISQKKYDNAVALAEAGKYTEAITAFKDLNDYSDSKEKVLECEYNYALSLEEGGKFAEAKIAFENLGDYSDASTRTQACAYSEAKEALENKNFKNASKLFMDLGDYGDSKEMVKECSYQNALSLIEEKDYKSAIEVLTAIRKYSDSAEKILEAKYMFVTDNFDKKNKTTVKYLNELTEENYRNSADLRKELLGSSEVLSDDIKALVNYSATDIETSLTELDNTKSIYFHAVVGDKSLYGKTLTLKYTTAFGYSQTKTVVLSESDNVAVMSYPATQYKNYTVDFELLDPNGQKIAGQKISF